MDKNIVRELQLKIKESIMQENYDEANTYYLEQLMEMSDSINSYNAKLDEYAAFLRNHYDRCVFSAYFEKEINRIINNYSIKMEDRYSLYMLAGNKEHQFGNDKEAIKWYRLAEEISKAKFVKSDKAEKMLHRIEK